MIGHSRWILVSALVVSVVGCDGGISFGDSPYTSLEDLQNWGVPSEEFSMTSFAINLDDNVIEFRYYTHGKKEDRKLVDPTVEKARRMTAKLRKKFRVRLIFVDGNPNMTINDKPVGSGKTFREVVLPQIP